MYRPKVRFQWNFIKFQYHSASTYIWPYFLTRFWYCIYYQSMLSYIQKLPWRNRKMKANQKLSTKKVVFTALMAALTCAASTARIVIPVDIGGTTAFHLGNIFCALSGILLGPWLGGLAAGLGSLLYDVIFYPAYISECWITFLTKGAYALAAGLIICIGNKDFGYFKAVLATLAGALTYAFLYLAKTYFYSGLLIKGLTPDAAWLSVLSKIPATIFNAVVALVFAPILAIALRKALKRNHLTIE